MQSPFRPVAFRLPLSVVAALAEATAFAPGHRSGQSCLVFRYSLPLPPLGSEMAAQPGSAKNVRNPSRAKRRS